MDKRKVITAYRRGFITMQECAQILGIDSPQIMGMMNDPDMQDARMRSEAFDSPSFPLL
ncbi:hypothetical protein D3C73_1621570 [compost metagenome]|jgi:predicted DNA-binding transcriptional regulator AlpA